MLARMIKNDVKLSMLHILLTFTPALFEKKKKNPYGND